MFHTIGASRQEDQEDGRAINHREVRYARLSRKYMPFQVVIYEFIRHTQYARARDNGQRLIAARHKGKLGASGSPARRINAIRTSLSSRPSLLLDRKCNFAKLHAHTVCWATNVSDDLMRRNKRKNRSQDKARASRAKIKRTPGRRGAQRANSVQELKNRRPRAGHYLL